MRDPIVHPSAKTPRLAAFALAVMLVSRQLPRRPFGAATGLWMSGFLMLGGGLMLGSIANGSPVDLLVKMISALGEKKVFLTTIDIEVSPPDDYSALSLSNDDCLAPSSKPLRRQQ